MCRLCSVDCEGKDVRGLGTVQKAEEKREGRREGRKQKEKEVREVQEMQEMSEGMSSET